MRHKCKSLLQAIVTCSGLFWTIILGLIPIPVSGTELRANISGTTLVFSWPADATNDFYLEESVSLIDPAGWRIITNSASQVAGEYRVTNLLTGPVRFYRLSAWEVLFNGSSTAAFRGYRQTSFPVNDWRVTTNGDLKTLSGSPQGHIITTNQYSDFELLWEWNTAAGGNSGVLYRVTESYADAWQSGPEYQIIDDSGYSLLADQTSGAVWGLIPPANQVLMPTGQWNQSRLLVQNNHVEHWMNGRLLLSYELNSPSFNSLIASSPSFSPYAQFGRAKTGYIAFQNWTPEVSYRHIKVRRLPAQ
jgi:3-keto-disaccharide hydrolase